MANILVRVLSKPPGCRPGRSAGALRDAQAFGGRLPAILAAIRDFEKDGL